MGRPYVYQPLESPDHFRFVELLPGTKDEPIRIELHAYHLDEAPPFDALSYMGQPPEPDINVICGEYEHSVGPNLYHILRSLRCAEVSRLLWESTISIYPQNRLEIVHLNRTTGRMHQAAVRTLVCLAHDNIQSLKDFIKYTQRLNQYRIAESHLSQAKDVFRSKSKITYQDLQEFEESVIRTQHGLATSGADELLKQPFFTTYAHTLYICYGLDDSQ